MRIGPYPKNIRARQDILFFWDARHPMAARLLGRDRLAGSPKENTPIPNGLSVI